MGTNWGQVDTALAALPGYTDKPGAIRAEYEQAVAKIQANEMASDRYKDQVIAKAKEVALEKLQNLRVVIGFEVDQIDRNRPAPIGSSDDPTAEARLARAVARVDRMLDGGVPYQSVIRAAVQAQDPLMILALREGLPSRVWAENLDMDEATRNATIEFAHQSLALAVATGFPGSDEGRWLAAKMQADLLAQIAQIQVRAAIEDTQGVRGDSWLDSVQVSLLQRDLDNLQSRLKDGTLSFETRQLNGLQSMLTRVSGFAENAQPSDATQGV